MKYASLRSEPKCCLSVHSFNERENDGQSFDNNKPISISLNNQQSDGASEEADSREFHTEYEPYISRKKQKDRLKAIRRHDVTRADSEETSDGWNQIEQKQLEVAIRSIPKGTPERWDRIADCIPSKSKIEIMNRVKHLSTLVRNKATKI
ncbi:DnaJ subfamily C member 1 [Fasciolopsis buskii]|uniref:DnaJ subfamily C member 1 n=1 Tax=Fasciolopsis buskii TaxID=27845 RepID=A0A8E0RIS1_9TREM|nr:DnaJ subfamily C member 1 [Fasciolopsis buski]